MEIRIHGIRLQHWPWIDDCPGCTALHLAIIRDNVDTIEALLRSGADPNVQDSYGRTALHFTGLYKVDGGYLATQLVKYGGDLHIKDQNGMTPLDTMSSKQRRWAMTQWIEMHRDQYPIAYGATSDCKLMIKALENNPSQEDLDLALLLVRGEKAMQMLINAGANPNIRDEAGRTPLFFLENEYMVAPLVRAGVDINARDHLGRTALHYADHMKLAPFIKAGGDPWLQDNFGYNAVELMYNPRDPQFSVNLSVDFMPESEYRNTGQHMDIPPFQKKSFQLVFTTWDTKPCKISTCTIKQPASPLITPFVAELVRQGRLKALKRLGRYGVRFETMPGITELAAKVLPQAIPVFEHAARLWRKRLCKDLPLNWYEDSDGCYDEAMGCKSLDEFMVSHPDLPNEVDRLIWSMLKKKDYGLLTHIIESGLVEPLAANRSYGEPEGSSFLAIAIIYLAVSPVLAMFRQINAEVKDLQDKYRGRNFNMEFVFRKIMWALLISTQTHVPYGDPKYIKRLTRLWQAFMSMAKQRGFQMVWTHVHDRGRDHIFHKVDVDSLEYLHNIGFNIAGTDTFGENLLFLRLKPEIIKWLLEHGVDPNQRNKAGETALFVHYNPVLLELLLDAGADPLIKDNYGIDPVLPHKRYRSAHVLVEAQARASKNWGAGSPNPLFDAQEYADVKQALNKGADINLAAGPHGITPLHLAVYMMRHRVVLALLKYGANPNVRLISGT